MLGYGGDGDGDAEGRKYEETREGVGEHAVQEEAHSRTERGAEFGLDDYVEPTVPIRYWSQIVSFW